MTDKEKLAEQYNAFCEELGLIKPIEILNACEVLDKVYKQGKHDATRWHYPSKGEYPTEKELVLMKVPGCYVIGWYYKKNWFMDDGELTVLPYDASHWQYIIPPKEEA